MTDELVVDLTRHGQSTSNLRVDCVGGREPEADLTSTGARQIEALGRRYKLCPSILILPGLFVTSTSPLVRTRKSADVFSEVIRFRPAVDDERLQEMSQGAWEGRPKSEIWTPEMRATQERLGADFKAPGGESQREVAARMQSWLDEQRQRFGGRGGRIVAFTHGIAMRCLALSLMHALDGSPFLPALWIDNARILRVALRDNRWVILGINLKDPY